MRVLADDRLRATDFGSLLHIFHRYDTALTNRWSQPLAVVKSIFDFMKQFPVFAALAAASGGSALSR